MIHEKQIYIFLLFSFRIHVNLLPPGGNCRHPAVENAKLRSNVVELLSEDQGQGTGNIKSLPLFKFIDSFEAR